MKLEGKVQTCVIRFREHRFKTKEMSWLYKPAFPDWLSQFGIKYTHTCYRIILYLNMLSLVFWLLYCTVEYFIGYWHATIHLEREMSSHLQGSDSLASSGSEYLD